MVKRQNRTGALFFKYGYTKALTKWILKCLKYLEKRN